MTEFYMTQPAELPKTLPVGTSYENPGTGRVACSTVARLEKGHQYWARWSQPNGDSWVHADEIDWTTVPREPPSPSPAPADELVVGAEYEGLGSPESKVSDQWFRGKYLGPFIGLDGHSRLQHAYPLDTQSPGATLNGHKAAPRCYQHPGPGRKG